jgi:hypothetical protein
MEMKQYFVAHIHVTVTPGGKSVRMAQYLCGPFSTKQEAETEAQYRLFPKGLVPEVVSQIVNVHLED